MLKIILTMISAMLIAVILMTLCTTISKNMNSDREKSSPFECGFDPKSTARLPFSLQFFLIAVLFLIFDIEIIIILPMMITLKLMNNMSWMTMMTLFMLTLLLGLYYEWKSGMLEWT
uniref:NADH-ubiquinone oxidoreductase chain 3 n=1 Tax=Dysdercus evanescens TaxID=941346 RepID=A0A4Y1JVX5_9HEMI|nr:NADH dehydrogenase subunit 3 [Dysdercus evanescens]APO08917.1 NADH dehydrogenase subunit 3 [Dysdercus evanescens]UPI55409.1 NADH dehydrogenase subunit 3 [Dysdercus evanescens]